MYVKKIAVVSANASLLQFFELECRLWGCEVHTFSKISSAIGTHDLIFVDVDTVHRWEHVEAERMVTISAEKTPQSTSDHLTWPTSLEEIHRLLGWADAAKTPLSETQKKNIPDALYIRNDDSREVRYGERAVTLSANEFQLLVRLGAQVGVPVRREVLMALFGAESGNIADVYVHHLRKKLEQLCEKRAITTIRGIGYRLELSLRYHEVNEKE